MTKRGGHVLIIDDEESMRHMLRLVLEREGYRIAEAAEGAAGLDILGQREFDLILCDIRMPVLDGRGFLGEAVRRQIPSTIIMMSAYGSIDTALECMKLGAYDYISKPFKPDEVVLTLRKAEERLRLQRENRYLKSELSRSSEEKKTIFKSTAMSRVLALAERVAEVSSPVLISGETGTGKELIARFLHSGGSRKVGPFVAVNCSAIAAGLMESELFGHARGAFSGADRENPGLFAAADGGILFLDEIGELPLELQPKLLRVLQEGEVRPVGHVHSRKIDVRVLAATARDLRKEVAEGRFREDLFYRLAVVEIEVPPLRDRADDIPLLAEYFLQRIALREKRSMPKLTSEVFHALQEYSWPGNVRELENLMEKTMIFCRGDKIDLASMSWEIRRRERITEKDLSLKKATSRLEREYIRKALEATGGNRTRAAELLEISLRGLMYKIKEYGFE